MEGNKLFGAGQYQEALSQYEFALQVAPEMPSSIEIRSICHANRAICFIKLVFLLTDIMFHIFQELTFQIHGFFYLFLFFIIVDVRASLRAP